MSVTTRSSTSSSAGGSGHGSERLETVARFGLVGKAVVHLVIGFLVWKLANGDLSGDAGSTGAIDWIAEQSWGTAGLVVLAASLGCLALWRGIEVFTGDPVEGDDAKERAKFAGSAVVYAGLAVLCVQALTGGSSSSGGGSGGGSGTTASSATSTVFDLPFGRFIVLAAGLGIIGVAGYMFVEHTVRERFLERVRVGSDSAVAMLGRVGYGLRAVAYGFVGVFLTQAAVSHDPDDAKGLGQSLRSVADASWGPWLLLGVAVGFAAYGAFCLCEAKLRRDA